MKRTVFCTLVLLLALLTPAAANSTPTRLDGVGGSALEVDENCPVMVSAEQLTFQIQRDNDYGRLCAQVTALYQMENPTEEPLTVPMAFYLEERKGQVGNGLEPSQVSVTADGQALSFTQQEVENDDPDRDRTALVYTVEFPAGGTREVVVRYPSFSYSIQEGTTYWRHTFTYLLSPAQYWAHFGTLDVEISAPEEAPYVIDSTLPLEEAGEGRYTAHFDGLPEGELEFTLYREPSITLWDRCNAFLQDAGYVMFFLGPVILVVAVLVIVGVLLRRQRR
ncbi:hypothetical protein [Flavonifractor sp. An306]|uniref:hypothetical protein n=1 Tax=Flavonifractor sp. An306 TaxID=1965629 RepID=UPI0017486C05|nr:hypothetical protein [Flavonifractor sp. An306]